MSEYEELMKQLFEEIDAERDKKESALLVVNELCGAMPVWIAWLESMQTRECDVIASRLTAYLDEINACLDKVNQ